MASSSGESGLVGGGRALGAALDRRVGGGGSDGEVEGGLALAAGLGGLSFSQDIEGGGFVIPEGVSGVVPGSRAAGGSGRGGGGGGQGFFAEGFGLELVSLIVAEGGIGRRRGRQGGGKKGDASGVVDGGGGGDYVLMERKTNDGGGGCFGFDGKWYVVVLMVDEGYNPLVRLHEWYV